MTYRGRIGQSSTEYRDLEIGLIGRHQAANAAIALATLERLMELGWSIPAPAIPAGLASVRCPARIEVLQTNPTVLIDTAHNPASIAALVDVLTHARGFAQRQLLFACSKDKDAAAMLHQLWPHFDRVILTRFVNNPRSHTPEGLAAILTNVAPDQRHATSVVLAPDPTSAWSLARASARPDDLICITGSFFLAAELRNVVGVGTTRKLDTY